MLTSRPPPIRARARLRARARFFWYETIIEHIFLHPDKGGFVGSPGCQPLRGQSWEWVRKKSQVLKRVSGNLIH